MFLNKYLKLVLSFVLLPCLCSVWAGEREVISVSGEASLPTQYHHAEIRARVISKNELAEQSIEVNNQKVDVTVSSLKKTGLSADNITTSNFNLSPQYRWQSDQSLFEGYVVTHSIDVIVDDIKSLGEILDVMIKSGVTHIDSVRFRPVNVFEIKKKALEKAVANAASRAEVLANAAGVKLGRPIHIAVQGNEPVYFSDGMQMEASSAAVPIMPGSGEVKARVLIEYQIVE